MARRTGHLLMGAAMAGILVPDLDLIGHRIWRAVFAAATAWFTACAPHLLRHRLIGAAQHAGAHLLGNAAMLYMLLAAPATSSDIPAAHAQAMPGMHMTGAVGIRLPLLALALGPQWRGQTAANVRPRS